jgi:hypothetical protein
MLLGAINFFAEMRIMKEKIDEYFNGMLSEKIVLPFAFVFNLLLGAPSLLIKGVLYISKVTGLDDWLGPDEEDEGDEWVEYEEQDQTCKNE